MPVAAGVVDMTAGTVQYTGQNVSEPTRAALLPRKATSAVGHEPVKCLRAWIGPGVKGDDREQRLTGLGR